MQRPEGQPLPTDDPAASIPELLERRQQYVSRSAAELRQQWAHNEWGNALLDGYESGECSTPLFACRRASGAVLWELR